jgi:hypothetical protein
LHLVKKFPAFHGTRRFITALTSVRPLVSILGQPNPVHMPTSHPIIVIVIIIIIIIIIIIRPYSPHGAESFLRS